MRQLSVSNFLIVPGVVVRLCKKPRPAQEIRATSQTGKIAANTNSSDTGRIQSKTDGNQLKRKVVRVQEALDQRVGECQKDSCATPIDQADKAKKKKSDDDVSAISSSIGSVLRLNCAVPFENNAY